MTSMATNINDVLTASERGRLRSTIIQFLRSPDYAIGDETGHSFETLEFGQPLPLEVVIRDWRTDLNDGTGGRDYRKGDCFDIYVKLYETGMLAIPDVDGLLGNIMKQ